MGEDWTDYIWLPAPKTLLCQFRRVDQGSSGWFVDYAKNFHPEFNIAGLEWKLTGIAKEELEQMGPQGRAQVMSSAHSFWLELLIGPVNSLGLSFYSASGL